MDNKYIDFALLKVEELVGIDSPTGFTEKASEYVKKEFEKLGFVSRYTTKGGVLVDLGGEDDENGIILLTHLDTIGAMVSAVKDNGRLAMSPLGGLHAPGLEGENVKVYTRSGKVFSGTIQLPNPSVHVADDFDKAERSWKTLECVLDEDVKTKKEAMESGVNNGDIVALDPKFRITDSGYIKSRFLDDKLSVGIALSLAKYISDNGITPHRKVWLHVTVYEEIGHGGSASVPHGVTEGLSIDMGCVGEGIECTERQVSICAKDSGGPYSYSVVSSLIEAAKREGADYSVDVYPHYGSDVETTLYSGFDIRHGLIGPGVYASHCYERSHRDGVKNTLLVLKGYLNI